MLTLQSLEEETTGAREGLLQSSEFNRFSSMHEVKGEALPCVKAFFGEGALIKNIDVASFTARQGV